MKELHICETVERSNLWVSRCPSSLCTAAYLHPLHLFGAEEGDVSLCPLHQQRQEARQHHTTAHAHSAPTWKTHRHVCMHILYAYSTAKGSHTHTHSTVAVSTQTGVSGTEVATGKENRSEMGLHA